MTYGPDYDPLVTFLIPLSIALPRKEREKARRKSEMLDAAAKVMASRSYAKATLDEIAKTAEYGKGTLYNYFPSGKEEILYSIVDELYDNLVEIAERELVDDRIAADTRKAFESFARAVLQYYDEVQNQFVIVVKETLRVLSDDDPKAPYFSKQRQRLIDALIPPLQCACQLGRMKPLPPHAVAHMLIGNINGCQMHTKMECKNANSEGPTVDERVGLLMSLLFDGLLNTHDVPAND